MRVLMICPELPTHDKPGTMAPGARQIASIEQAGVEVQIADMRGIPKFKYLQMLPRIRRAIGQVDLVHAHFGYCGWLAQLGKWSALQYSPIVMSFMGSDLLGSPYNEVGDLTRLSQCEIACNRIVARQFQQVIVKSREMAERIPHIRCHVIPNGVDLELFRPIDRVQACQQIGLDPARVNVLFPGNPNDPRKGFGLAQQSVKVAESLLACPIHLVPLWKVRSNDVVYYMNACNAMLMTSVFEGSPNVVKEAMACNQNVIGVPVGDVHELLQNVTGCYRTDRNSQTIGQALAHAIRTDRRSEGRRAIEERGLSLEGVAQQILGVYRLALQSDSKSRDGESNTSSRRSTLSNINPVRAK